MTITESQVRMLLEIARATVPTYERLCVRGRIAGDASLLSDFGRIATPSAILALCESYLRSQSDDEADKLDAERYRKRTGGGLDAWT